MGDLIRTGEAATILGSSRQHVIDLVERGELANRGHGAHRLLERSEVETLAGLVRPRDERQRLWVHRAVAGKIALDPARSMARARRDLGLMKATDAGRTRSYARWAELLALGPEALMRAMTAETPEGDELRRQSPVLGILPDEERRAVHQAFGYVDHHVADPSTVAMAHRRLRRLERVAARRRGERLLTGGTG